MPCMVALDHYNQFHPCRQTRSPPPSRKGSAVAESADRPELDGLFNRWRESHNSGTLLTATQLAGDDSELTGPLQERINQYFSVSSAGDGETVTAPPSPDPSLNLPPDLPDFTLLRELGHGGMGYVYLARDRLGREVAVKVIRPDRLTTAGVDRFHDEARAMHRLGRGHPHIVRVGHFGIHRGAPYFVMDVYPSSLDRQLADHQKDPGRALRLMATVADAVGHLHANGFFHRDLKPRNVLLSGDGRPAVSDFGLAKGTVLSPDAAPGSADDPSDTPVIGARRSPTVVGTVMGTRPYMHPEQAAGLSERAGPHWDVWALGVMLHELLTGELPLSSAAPRKLLDPDEPDNPPPSSVKPGLDPLLERIIQRCLARREADRYPDARPLADELRALAPGDRARWRRLVAMAALAGWLGLVLLTVYPLSGLRLEPARTAQRQQARATAESNSALAAAFLDNYRAKLKSGETVTLMDATGLPVWSEVVVGRGAIHPLVDEEERTCSLKSRGNAFLELMRDAGISRYRFEVQVRQNSLATGARAGLFAGRHAFQGKTGPGDAYATLMFNELAGPNNKAKCELSLMAFYHAQPSIANGQVIEASPSFDRNLMDGRPDWRTLVVDAKSDGLTFYFDGKQVKHVPRPLVGAAARQFEKNGWGVQADFSPAGGLGVCVFNGQATFRNAKIVPAP